MRALISRIESRWSAWVAYPLSIAAALFILIPLSDYYRDPVYHWEMGTSEFILGGLTALGLFVLVTLVALLRIRNTYKIIVISALVLLYLRLYSVDLPFFFMLLWLESMVAVGALLLPRKLVLPGAALISIKFASGVAVWTAVALVLSAFHLATPLRLLIVTILLLIVGLWRSGWKPLFPSVTRYLTNSDRMIAIASSYLLVSVAVLFARAPHNLDFDSLWYGLRSQWVLAPHGSIFDRLYFPHFVFYYPKLFELLNLPTDYFQNYTYTIALNIALYFSYAVCIVAVMRCLGMRQRHAFLVAACIVSLPAVSTMSLTAKPDNLANYFMLTATLCFVLGLQRNNLWLLGTLAMLLLALKCPCFRRHVVKIQQHAVARIGLG